MKTAFRRILLLLLLIILCPVLPSFAQNAPAFPLQAEDSVQTILSVQEEGYYHLLIHYERPVKGSCTLSLYLNGRFARKAVFSSGEMQTLAVPVYFSAGENSVMLRRGAGDGEVHILSVGLEPRSSQTKMVIVPHEDDEVFAFGGSIMHMLENGDDVRVVLITNGDFFGVEFGSQRILESVDALERIGLPAENIIFMGYPDSSLPALFKAGNSVEPLSFPTGLPHTYAAPEANIYDYHTLQTGEAAVLSGSCIRDDFLNILSVNMPSEIYVTSQYDDHGDHEHAYLFTAETIRTIQQTSDYAPLVHEGIVHSEIGDGFWPKRLVYDEEENLLVEPFTCPFSSEEEPLRWADATRIELTEDMIENKHFAIEAYYSQNELMKEGGDAYNYAFVKSDEFYWTTDFAK